MNALGVGLAVLAACFLAGQALTVRLATRAGSTGHVLLVVLGVNTALFVPAAIAVGDVPTPRAVAVFAAAGVVSTTLGRTLFYAGIKRVGAARAEPLKASTPLYATVLAAVLLGETVTGPQFAGVLLIVAGVAVVSWDGARGAAGGVDPVGIVLPLAGAFMFGLEPILAVVGFRAGAGVLAGLAIKSVAATAVTAGFLAARGSLPSRASLAGDGAWYAAAGLANTGFLVAYYAGLSVAAVAIVVPIMQTSPLVVAAVSAVYLRGIERVTPVLVAGSAVVVVGAALVSVFG